MLNADERLKKPWLAYIKPFKIYGNLYYIGSSLVCTHLIDTDEGLIIIDPGYPQTLYQIIYNISLLGFSVNDIKYIICTHGHYDHLGAAKSLKELCGAKIIIGKGDKDFANGTLDLTWAKELGFEYNEAFEPDILIQNNDIIKLGSTEILCKDASGHTPGTMAFFFYVTENSISLRAGLHGGVGFNSMKKEFLDSYNLSYATRENFVKNIDTLIKEPVDIHLGNHQSDNQTLYKASVKTEEFNPFIDKSEWESFLNKKRIGYFEMIKTEMAAT